jgi:hypothetical protein
MKKSRRRREISEPVPGGPAICHRGVSAMSRAQPEKRDG